MSATHEIYGRKNTTQKYDWLAFGVKNFAIVLVLSVLFWWLIADPKWSPFDIYPQPFQAWLFWAILCMVFLGFNLEFAGLTRLRQPARGLVAVLLVCVAALVIVLVLGYGLGRLDPTFAASRAGGLGWQSGQLYVLFGFLTYVAVVLNWQHWPWSRTAGQPYTGLGDIALMTIPAIALYLVFAMPNLAVWAHPGAGILSSATTTGWFYAMIVSVILTGQLWDNWPWRAFGSGGRTALASVVGNLVLGTVLYFALLWIAELLLGSTAVAQLGAGVTSMAAELGVCWVFWIIMWANAFENRPALRSTAATYLARALITLLLGIVSFAVYSYLLAPYVLHEPTLAGSAHGDALGWMDWMILWTLFYITCLDSPGLRRNSTKPAAVSELADA